MLYPRPVAAKDARQRDTMGSRTESGVKYWTPKEQDPHHRDCTDSQHLLRGSAAR